MICVPWRCAARERNRRLAVSVRDDEAVGHGHADRVDAVDRVHVAGLAAPRNSSAFRSTAIRRDRVGERDHVAAGHVRPAWVTAGFAVQVDAVLAEQCPEHGVVLMDELAGLDADAQLRLRRDARRVSRRSSLPTPACLLTASIASGRQP